MKHILSEEELQSLLKEPEKKTVSDISSAKGTSILPYLNNFYDEKFPVIKLLHTNLTNEIEDNLKNFLQRNCEVILENIQVKNIKKFLQEFEKPTVVSFLEIIPLDSYHLIFVDEQFFHIFMKRQKKFFQPRLIKTFLQKKKIKKFFQKIHESIQNSWNRFYPVIIKEHFSLVNTADIIEEFPQEEGIFINYCVSIHNTDYHFISCLPYSVLGIIETKIAQGLLGTKEKNISNKNLLQQIADKEMSIRAILDKPTAKLEDISRLEVGDYILLNLKPNSPFFLEIEGKKKFKVNISPSSDKRKVQIIEKLESAHNKK